MITEQDVAWRYIQTGDLRKACLFFSIGSDGQTEDIHVSITNEERIVIQSIIDRGLIDYISKKNGVG